MWQDDSGRADIHLRMSWLTTARSVGLLAIVGLLSGIIPAIKASRMNPIEALRYE
jgi:putative ABC transport system permease protein